MELRPEEGLREGERERERRREREKGGREREIDRQTDRKRQRQTEKGREGGRDKKDYVITGHSKKSVSRTVHLFFVGLYYNFTRIRCINND